MKTNHIQEIHTASLLLAQVFNDLYRDNQNTDAVLNAFREVRRLLPKMEGGKRFGADEANLFMKGADKE